MPRRDSVYKAGNVFPEKKMPGSVNPGINDFNIRFDCAA